MTSPRKDWVRKYRPNAVCTKTGRFEYTVKDGDKILGESGSPYAAWVHALRTINRR